MSWHDSQVILQIPIKFRLGQNHRRWSHSCSLRQQWPLCRDTVWRERLVWSIFVNCQRKFCLCQIMSVSSEGNAMAQMSFTRYFTGFQANPHSVSAEVNVLFMFTSMNVWMCIKVHMFMCTCKYMCMHVTCDSSYRIPSFPLLSPGGTPPLPGACALAGNAEILYERCFYKQHDSN